MGRGNGSFSALEGKVGFAGDIHLRVAVGRLALTARLISNVKLMGEVDNPDPASIRNLIKAVLPITNPLNLNLLSNLSGLDNPYVELPPQQTLGALGTKASKLRTLTFRA